MNVLWREEADVVVCSYMYIQYSVPERRDTSVNLCLPAANTVGSQDFVYLSKQLFLDISAIADN